MLKFISLLIFVPVLFSFFNPILSDFDVAKEKISSITTPTPQKNMMPEVTKLNISKTEIYLSCPPEAKSQSACDDDPTIDVHAESLNADNNTVTYQYTVSAGRIIGKGAKVKWDLSNVRFGTYEIIVAVSDKRGVKGKAQKALIDVRECEDCISDCVCPEISVRGSSESLLPRELMTFTANVSGAVQDEVTYKWTVEKGTIIEGQETPMVKVLPETPDSVVTATVEIGGMNEFCYCSNTASAKSRVD